MIDLKAVLSRKQKEELVLDLYFNQNKTTHEIAKTASELKTETSNIKTSK